MMKVNNAIVVTSEAHDYDLIQLHFTTETYAFPTARANYLAMREEWLNKNNPAKKAQVMENINNKKPGLFMSLQVEKGQGEAWVRNNTGLEPILAVATADHHMESIVPVSVD